MEDKKSFEIRFVDFWTVLKRCWFIMLAVMVVVAAGTFIVMKVTHESEYTSTATLYVGETNSENMSSGDITIANSLVKDFNELITSNKIINDVYKVTGSMLEPAQIKNMIKISNPDGTHVLYLSVTAKDPESAALFANAFAEAAENNFNDLFSAATDNDKTDSTNPNKNETKILQVFDDGVVPQHESNPISFVKITLIALIVALLVYVAFFVVYVLDDKINTAEDVQRYLGMSLLGEIPNREDAGRRKSKYGYYASETTTPAKPNAASDK